MVKTEWIVTYYGELTVRFSQNMYDKRTECHFRGTVEGGNASIGPSLATFLQSYLSNP